MPGRTTSDFSPTYDCICKTVDKRPPCPTKPSPVLSRAGLCAAWLVLPGVSPHLSTGLLVPLSPRTRRLGQPRQQCGASGHTAPPSIRRQSRSNSASRSPAGTPSCTGCGRCRTEGQDPRGHELLPARHVPVGRSCRQPGPHLGIPALSTATPGKAMSSRCARIGRIAIGKVVVKDGRRFPKQGRRGRRHQAGARSPHDKIGSKRPHTMHPSHALKFVGTFVGIFFMPAQRIQYPCGFLTYLRFLSKHQQAVDFQRFFCLVGQTWDKHLSLSSARASKRKPAALFISSWTLQQRTRTADFSIHRANLAALRARVAA